MSTIKLDRICVDLVSRIPDQLQSAFTPGTGPLPNGYVITADSIVNYVNRALQEFFHTYFDGLVVQQKNIRAFMKAFPELIKFSQAVSLTSGNYSIVNPYLDFHRIIGCVTENNIFIKIWNDDKYTLALSGEYEGLTATATDPAVIQVNKMLAIFPQNSTFKIKFHYIGLPVDPTTGSFLIQNGSYDSPFYDIWNKSICDIAELMWLKDGAQTK